MARRRSPSTIGRCDTPAKPARQAGLMRRAQKNDSFGPSRWRRRRSVSAVRLRLGAPRRDAGRARAARSRLGSSARCAVASTHAARARSTPDEIATAEPTSRPVRGPIAQRTLSARPMRAPWPISASNALRTLSLAMSALTAIAEARAVPGRCRNAALPNAESARTR
jgi:hypothetical protein